MSDKNQPRRVPAKQPGEKPAQPNAPRAAAGGSGGGGQTPSKGVAPSMKERLLAQRRAAEEAAAAAPARGKTFPSASKPAAGKAPAQSARSGASKSAMPPARPTIGAAKSSGATARPAGARAVRGGGDEGGGSSRRRATEREPKKKSPVPLIATGLLVVVVGGVGAFFALKEDKAPETTDQSADTTTASGGAEGTSPAEGTETDTNPDGMVADGGSDTGSKPAAAGAGAGGTKPVEGPTAEERLAAGIMPSAKDPDSWNSIAITKTDQVNDPTGVDLAKLQPYGKPPGMDDARWASLTDDAKVMFDPLAGVKGSRASKRLAEAGFDAWPAITNELIKLNPRLPADSNQGKLAEGLLDQIRGGVTGNGFNWRMPAVSEGELERKDLFYNMQLIVELHDVWRRHLSAPNVYLREKIAQGKVKDKMNATGAEEAPADAGAGDGIDIDFSDLGGG